MLTGSLVDTLIVMKQQKNENLEAHRQRLCMQKLKVQKLTVKNGDTRKKLNEKREQLSRLHGQTGYKICRKLRLFHE